MNSFFCRFWPRPKPLDIRDPRIDALTFAVIRGEMTIQELQVRVREQSNTIEALESEVRALKLSFTERLTPYLDWDELREELKRE